MRFATAISFFLLASQVSARDLRISVLTLFRPTQLVVIPAEPAVANGRFVSPGSRVPIQHAPFRLTGLERGPVTFTLSVPGRIERKYRGTLEVLSDAGVLTPVLTVDLETAVGAALAAEMPEDAPAEALKAMAIAIRSYYASGGRHARFEFCDTTHCQWLKSPAEPGHAAARAALDTSGVVLTYDGRPFAPYYSAACGGRTRTPAEVGLRTHGYPYRATECRICLRESVKWERRVPVSLAPEILDGPSELVRLRVQRKLGWDALPANDYSIDRDGSTLVLTGSGNGHGIGLCQRGAIGLGHEGADWHEIIVHYLPQAIVKHAGE